MPGTQRCARKHNLALWRGNWQRRSSRRAHGGWRVAIVTKLHFQSHQPRTRAPAAATNHKHQKQNGHATQAAPRCAPLKDVLDAHVHVRTYTKGCKQQHSLTRALQCIAAPRTLPGYSAAVRCEQSRSRRGGTPLSSVRRATPLAKITSVSESLNHDTRLYTII